MLTAYVDQLLEVELIRQKRAEPLKSLIVPRLGLEAALTVVPCQLVQLDNQRAVCARLHDFLCHM